MARDLNAIFEGMISDMCALANDDLLNPDKIMSERTFKYIPLRYRIIALGFVKHFTLQELNDKLTQYGCPRLYLRSFWEATLIFAFLNGYSYEDWKHISEQCADIYASMEEAAWFHGKSITYGELQRYVLQNSDAEGDMFATQQHTQYLEGLLSGVSDSTDAFRAFLQNNVRSFSTVREKSRYYFCKYLYYYLNLRIEDYFEAVRRERGVDEALSALLPLKVVTVLRRKRRMPEAEKRALICESALSCGEIFDEFNYFFFGYVSLDWVEILLECYERVQEIPAEQKKRIAAIFRKNRPDFKALSDEEVIERRMQELEMQEDDIYAREGSRGYNKNRAGEHAVYKYIQGALDINRTALICFLLFFGGDRRLPRACRLTPNRINDILIRCGYAPVDIENDFDWFVVEFLESKRPVEFLTEVMTEYARRNENSFLYHLYSGSIHYEDELLRIMIHSKATQSASPTQHQ